MRLVPFVIVWTAVGCSPKPAPPPPEPTGPHRVWTFEAPEPGSVVAGPVVTPDAVFLAAAHARGFRQHGAVYALDPATGKPKWVFDADGDMLPTASPPLVAGGRVV